MSSTTRTLPQWPVPVFNNTYVLLGEGWGGVPSPNNNTVDNLGKDSFG